MHEKDERPSTKSPLVVSVKSIIIAAVAFILGIAFIFILENLLVKEEITWSTPSLLSLVSTVALGAASVVLTWVAHRISKDSEQKLTDIFLKTNESLSRIQTSTGVTERRVEDIISGRAAKAIADEAVDISTRRYPLTGKAAEEMKQEIAERLREELTPFLSSPGSQIEQHLTGLEDKHAKRVEIERQWSEFRKPVADNLSKYSDIKVISETEGIINAEKSEDFWDAVLEIGSKRIGLQLFIKAQAREGWLGKDWVKKDEREYFLKQVLRGIRQDDLDLVFIAFDSDVWQEVPIREMAQDFERYNETNTEAKIIKIHGDPVSLADQIYSISKREGTQSSDTTAQVP